MLCANARVLAAQYLTRCAEEARAGEQIGSLICMKVETAMWAELAAPGAKSMLAGEHMPDAESAAFWKNLPQEDRTTTCDFV